MKIRLKRILRFIPKQLLNCPPQRKPPQNPILQIFPRTATNVCRSRVNILLPNSRLPLFGSREREGKPAQHFSFTSLEEFQSLKFARSKC
ncbi:hypothetical protein ACFX1X_020806 [Malus domestica]